MKRTVTMMGGGDWVIGVDGGGTKTVACLAVATAAGPEILGRGVAGPANLRAVGKQAATANLNAAIDAAFARAGVARQEVSTAWLGLAGADRPEERQAFTAWAKSVSLAKHVRITNDAWNVLYGANPQGQGVALIAGTGSFAFGADASGATARCGGWGYLFGDEGSGYAIAIEGLRAAARCADGRGPHTALLERLLSRLRLSSPAGLITTLYSSDRPLIAELSRVVFEASDEDAVAREITFRAATQLAELVSTVARQLQLPQPASLALAGGVLLHQPTLRQQLLDALAVDSSQPTFDPVDVADPATGAVNAAVVAQAASL
ncbi:MAG: hypothetical protein KDB14_31460 [Planctomycetales bacterium]|nr:hypothetical protein [Planctomycetales bacterium]